MITLYYPRKKEKDYYFIMFFDCCLSMWCLSWNQWRMRLGRLWMCMSPMDWTLQLKCWSTQSLEGNTDHEVYVPVDVVYLYIFCMIILLFRWFYRFKPSRLNVPIVLFFHISWNLLWRDKIFVNSVWFLFLCIPWGVMWIMLTGIGEWLIHTEIIFTWSLTHPSLHNTESDTRWRKCR